MRRGHKGVEPQEALGRTALGAQSQDLRMLRPPP